MTPVVDYAAFRTLLMGPDPPLKGETESTDDFQTRVIGWLMEDRKHTKALLWAVLLMLVNAQWVHLGA